MRPISIGVVQRLSDPRAEAALLKCDLVVTLEPNPPPRWSYGRVVGLGQVTRTQGVAVVVARTKEVGLMLAADCPDPRRLIVVVEAEKEEELVVSGQTWTRIVRPSFGRVAKVGRNLVAAWFGPKPRIRPKPKPRKKKAAPKAESSER